MTNIKFLQTENTKTGYKASRAVIIPVPYEKTTSYGKGAKNGPSAILKASCFVEHYDIEEGRVISDIGISTLPALKPIKDEKALFKSAAMVTDKVISDGKIPVYLGGEHTITAAIVSALKEHYSDFSILHFDAHSDLRNTYGGIKYSHACVMRRVYEMCVPIVSVGIRSQSSEEHEFIREAGASSHSLLHIFYMHEIHNDKNWINKVISKLGKNIYISFDVDVFDPAYLRATGTPEPDGLSWKQAVDLLKAVKNSGKHLLGADMVELAPVKGDHVSDFVCAKLVSKLLALFVK